MKKLLFFIALIFSITSVNAQDLMLQASAEFDWVDITQIQRDAKIDYYHNILFENEEKETYSKKEFKQKYSDFMKDSQYQKHYIKAKADIREIEDANLCAFKIKNDILLIYAVQYKNNLRSIYYYDCFGHLQYIDEVSENYPNYPYFSKQYRKNGKLISAIFFISKDMQYMYEPNGKFKGIWFKDKMYDKSGNQILTRTNWGI